MKKIIFYTQEVPVYDPETNEITGSETVEMQCESNNEKDFQEQLETVKGYCDDWRVEEMPHVPTIEERLNDLENAFMELVEEVLS